MLSSSLAPPPVPGQADPVRNVDISSFMTDVIEVSREKLVVVDFWAPWCGPCKQLGPILEKLVRSYKGSVILAKIDIDRNQQIAQQMGVQSIPAVFAFSQGRPLDGFMGALPEAQIKEWLEQLIKTTGTAAPTNDLASALKQADEFLASKDIEVAQSIYEDVLDQEPENAHAYAGVLRCLMASGNSSQAKEKLATVPVAIAKDKALDPIRTALELEEQSAMAGSLLDLQGKVAANPDQLECRFDLAMAYYAAGQREEAVDQLLDIVRRNRTWNDDGARKQLVKFFEAFGAMDPLTVSSRKRLSSILFS